MSIKLSDWIKNHESAKGWGGTLKVPCSNQSTVFVFGGINMFSDLLFATTGNNSGTTKGLGRDKRLRLSFAILWCEGKADA
jgi:hypothetical protein